MNENLPMTLRAWLRESGLTDQQFAEMVGYSLDAVRHWKCRRRTPRRLAMQKIEAVTEGRVTPASFYAAANDNQATPEEGSAHAAE